MDSTTILLYRRNVGRDKGYMLPHFLASPHSADSGR